MFITNWIKKAVIKMGIKYVVSELNSVETKIPDIKEFHEALYNKSINQFMKWGLEKLEGSSLDTVTPIQLLEKRIEPINDIVEGYIKQILEGLKP